MTTLDPGPRVTSPLRGRGAPGLVKRWSLKRSRCGRSPTQHVRMDGGLPRPPAFPLRTKGGGMLASCLRGFISNSNAVFRMFGSTPPEDPLWPRDTLFFRKSRPLSIAEVNGCHGCVADCSPGSTPSWCDWRGRTNVSGLCRWVTSVPGLFASASVERPGRP